MPKGGVRPLCSVEGCEGLHHARGYCGAHFQRFMRWGDPGDPLIKRGTNERTRNRCRYVGRGVVAIDLYGGRRTLIDEADLHLVKGLRLSFDGQYARWQVWDTATKRSRGERLHAFLMQTPPGLHTDHINGDRLDNRRSNLRVVSTSLNAFNQRRQRSNKTGHRGVEFRRGPRLDSWTAYIRVNQHSKNLGSFRTKEEAIEARRAAELQYFGELSP